VRPKVWRNFFVPSDISLEELNGVFLDVMGWEGCHLCACRVNGRRLINSGEDFENRPLLPFPGPGEDTALATIRLDRLGLAKGSTFTREYGFGDGWEHKLSLLDTNFQPKRPGQRYGCLKGKRRGPPEDCGGPWGYETLLEAIADPSHPRRGELLEWAGADFAPEFFSAKDVTDIMQP
jgi:hypothetical protein